MPIESTVANTTRDISKKGLQAADGGLKKVWSILDAASEKKAPSEILSPKAIQAIQGKVQGA
jgi:hypothetical protein